MGFDLNAAWSIVIPSLIKNLVLVELNEMNEEYAEKYKLLCEIYSSLTAYEMILEFLTDEEKVKFKQLDKVLAIHSGDK